MDKIYHGIGRVVVSLVMVAMIAIGGYVGIKQLEGVHVVREPGRQYASVEQDGGRCDSSGDYIGCLIGGGK